MIDRRAFVALFATSAGSFAALTRLEAQIQPGTMPVSVDMVREAAKLAGLTWTDDEAREVTDALSRMAKGAEKIDKDSLTNASPLPIHFDPRPVGVQTTIPRATLRLAAPPRVKRPPNLEDAAFWPLAELASLVRTRQATSTELTRMYLERLKRHNPQLNCVVSLTETRALQEAADSDREIAAGKYRGPLHGIPYGVKDIVAAVSAPTTWGAPPLETQTFDEDATVVKKLRAAGAVLVAKLSTGELAFGDQWARGRTNNPWNVSEGSSGSSAGSASATAAGLVGFAIGTDTGGSILSPAQRCGIVGLRPTFGTVSRHGVMAAGTSLDKVGPLCRYADDCAVVMQAIVGADGLDLAVPDSLGFNWDGTSALYPKRIGYVPSVMEAEKDPDRRANYERALATLQAMGCTLREVSLPDGDLSYFIEYTERAAAFDSMTRHGFAKGVRPRTSQFLRACQLVTAVDYLQANRRRAAIMQDVARTLSQVDALFFTLLTLDSRTSLNPVMSLTGHPSVAVPNGFTAKGSPMGVMFSGQLYRDGEVLALGRAFERATATASRIPPEFAPRG
jgi:Asp-tRNA(Asn)/Glu-tRNA(Gln) amidotransferase A subunit family amidase